MKGVHKAGFHREGHICLHIYSLVFLNCVFYQLLCVQQSCSSTESRGSVLLSIVETRDKNYWSCPPSVLG